MIMKSVLSASFKFFKNRVLKELFVVQLWAPTFSNMKRYCSIFVFLFLRISYLFCSIECLIKDRVVLVHDTQSSNSHSNDSQFMEKLCLSLHARGNSLHCIKNFMWIIRICLSSIFLRKNTDKITYVIFFISRHVLLPGPSCLFRELIYAVHSKLLSILLMLQKKHNGVRLNLHTFVYVVSEASRVVLKKLKTC